MKGRQRLPPGRVPEEAAILRDTKHLGMFCSSGMRRLSRRAHRLTCCIIPIFPLIAGQTRPKQDITDHRRSKGAKSGQKRSTEDKWGSWAVIPTVPLDGIPLCATFHGTDHSASVFLCPKAMTRNAAVAAYTGGPAAVVFIDLAHRAV